MRAGEGEGEWERQGGERERERKREREREGGVYKEEEEARERKYVFTPYFIDAWLLENLLNGCVLLYLHVQVLVCKYPWFIHGNNYMYVMCVHFCNCLLRTDNDVETKGASPYPDAQAGW